MKAKLSASERLFSRVKRGPQGCWLWTGAISGGRGTIKLSKTLDGERRTEQVHRLAYRSKVGEIPKGKCIGQICKQPLCVNPHHLYIKELEPLKDRFQRKFSIDSLGCWRWQGYISEWGYGKFAVDTIMMPAHRIAYELWKGPIPRGLTLDHLCRVRDCVNPDHLEPVTLKENTLRGISPSAQNARKVYCKRGHPLWGDNIYPNRSNRACRKCAQDNARRHYYNRKACPMWG